MTFLIEFSHLQDFISRSQPIVNVCIDETYWTDPVIIDVRQQPTLQTQLIPSSTPIEWFIQPSQTTFQLLISSFDRADRMFSSIKSFPYVWLIAKIEDRPRLFEMLDSIQYEVKLEYEREKETEVFCTLIKDFITYPKFVDPKKLEQLFNRDPFSRSLFEDTKFKSNRHPFEEEDDKPVVLKIVNPFLA